MKVCIVGKESKEFTVEDTGEVVRGAKLYYFAPKDEVDGFFAGEMWIRFESRMYGVVMSLNTQKPFMADIEYDEQPGKKRPIMVMMGITPLEKSDIAKLANNVYWKEFIGMQPA